jgi:hypothetical protein
MTTHNLAIERSWAVIDHPYNEREAAHHDGFTKCSAASFTPN